MCEITKVDNGIFYCGFESCLEAFSIDEEKSDDCFIGLAKAVNTVVSIPPDTFDLEDVSFKNLMNLRVVSCGLAHKSPIFLDLDFGAKIFNHYHFEEINYPNNTLLFFNLNSFADVLNLSTFLYTALAKNKIDTKTEIKIYTYLK